METTYSGFRYEHEMLPWIIHSLPAVLDHDATVAWATEYGKGYRLIDLLAAFIFEQPETWGNWASRARILKKLTYTEMEALAVLTLSKRVTPRYLSKKTWLPITDTRRYISDFVNYGLAERLSRRSYGPTAWAKQMPVCLVAIEAKLKDWASALKQATYNKSAVDYSYVAMPLHEFRNRNIVLNEFRKQGIGVLGLTNEGQSEVLVRARRVQVNLIDYSTMILKVVSELPLSGKWMHVQSGINCDAKIGTF